MFSVRDAESNLQLRHNESSYSWIGQLVQDNYVSCLLSVSFSCSSGWFPSVGSKVVNNTSEHCVGGNQAYID